MLSIKINILYFVLITIIVGIQSLLKLSTEEDNSIKLAQTIIQNIVNKLFATFKIQAANQQHRLKQFFTIHDLFVSITLTDCDNLREIVRLSRVNDIDNIQYLITQINEVLNEGDKSSEANGSDLFVAKYIEKFIGKLKYLKEKYDTKRKTILNATILTYLNDNRRNLRNVAVYNNSIGIKIATEAEIDDANISSYTEYWQPSGRRIYKGFRTRIKNFPFIASVQFFKKFQCAGSIIKNDLVITSASCLQLSWNNRFFRENPSFLSVQIGSDFYEHGGENIAVQEIYFHPRYDPKTLRHNLAVMRLSRRIAFKNNQKRVRKIDIDRQPSPLLGYDHITVLGWGARDSSNIIYNVLENRLSYANLDFYPLDECREHYTREFVSKKNFCAGFFSKGAGACNRDAGGPAIIGYTLMGVISFGSPICGSPGSPTVFTKLGYYADWIDEIMEQDVPSVYKRTTTPLPDMIFAFGETTTKTSRLTPVVTTKSPVPTYVDDLRTAQKESSNDISSYELYEKYNSELNKNKQQTLYTNNKNKVVTIKMVGSYIKHASQADNKIRQQQFHNDEINDSLIGISMESISNSTTQASIKITKLQYNEDTSNYKSIETDTGSVNEPPIEIKNKLKKQQFNEHDGNYDSTETDPESDNGSSPETTIKLPQQQISNDVNKYKLNNIGSITVNSNNAQVENKLSLHQYAGTSNDVMKKIKHQTFNINKIQKQRNLKRVRANTKMKTITSVTTIVSLDKPTAQARNKLSHEGRNKDESIGTKIESLNSHPTELKNKLTQLQFNVGISDDVIKKYIKQILNITKNKKEESIQKVQVKSKTAATATTIVLPNKSTEQDENKLRQRQFKEDANNDESLETVTESVNKYVTELKKKLTQQQFNIGVSDGVLKKYIIQFLKEKGYVQKAQVKSTTNTTVTPIVSSIERNAQARNKLSEQLFNEDHEKTVEVDTDAVNDILTRQQSNEGGSHALINMSKKQTLQITKNKEKGTIKKMQVKPKLKLTTSTGIVSLNKPTKNKLRQEQFEADTESVNDKLRQQRFNTDGSFHELIETDIGAVKEITTLEKDANVRDIKDDVMALIDNLDIDQLLDQVDNSKKQDVTIGELNEMKKDTINLKQWTSLKYLFSSDEDDQGLSIPAESLQNLSLRNLPESIEYNKIPKSILFDLVSLAVEEEIKRKAEANKTIHNGRHYII